MALHPARIRIVDLARKTAADQKAHGLWTYWFVRPTSVEPYWQPGQRVKADCSKGAQKLCRWALAPDPMDNGFADWGNSNTIWVTLEHVDRAQLEPGDPITFGYYAGEKHVCVALEKGTVPDPDVWNMGKQGQPVVTKLSVEIAAHLGMRVTYCKLPLPDVPPPPMTAEEKLRARTGFYSWVGWRLGEGPWKHYGKRNRKVRPNVPSRIPAGWWTRYAQFIANRKKGNPSA